MASAETAANAAAAEAALERAKSRDMAARAAQLEDECATAVTRSTAAAEEAGRYRSTAGELRKQAKHLEGLLATARADLQAAQEQECRARQVRHLPSRQFTRMRSVNSAEVTLLASREKILSLRHSVFGWVCLSVTSMHAGCRQTQPRRSCGWSVPGTRTSRLAWPRPSGRFPSPRSRLRSSMS